MPTRVDWKQRCDGFTDACIEDYARNISFRHAPSLDDRLDEIDRELSDLSQSKVGDSLVTLRNKGICSLSLLIDRHHLTNQIWLGPAFAIVTALKGLSDTRAGISPLLDRSARLTSKANLISDHGHAWIKSNAAALGILLVACHGYSLNKASKTIAEALRSGEYIPLKGGGEIKGNTVEKWIKSAVTSTAADEVRDALLCTIEPWLASRPYNIDLFRNKSEARQLIDGLSMMVGFMQLPMHSS